MPRVLPTLNIIAAVSENCGIGYKGSLPWKLKTEMKFFQEKTTETNQEGKQNAVVMGRKTWYSIPEKFRPLSKRVNVVLSRSESQISGAHLTAKTLEEAVSYLTTPPVAEKVDQIFVIGGEAIYKQIPALISDTGSDTQILKPSKHLASFAQGLSHLHKLALDSDYPIRMYKTLIHSTFECDTFFPKYQESDFVLAQDQDVPQGIQNENGISFTYKVYVRDGK